MACGDNCSLGLLERALAREDERGVAGFGQGVDPVCRRATSWSLERGGRFEPLVCECVWSVCGPVLWSLGE